MCCGLLFSEAKLCVKQQRRPNAVPELYILGIRNSRRLKSASAEEKRTGGFRIVLEPKRGVEPLTYGLRNSCSTN
jgi:hypothetical protein